MLRGTAIGLACNIQRGWRAKAPISTFAAPVCPINGGTRLPKREGLVPFVSPLLCMPIFYLCPSDWARRSRRRWPEERRQSPPKQTAAYSRRIVPNPANPFPGRFYASLIDPRRPIMPDNWTPQKTVSIGVRVFVLVAGNLVRREVVPQGMAYRPPDKLLERCVRPCLRGC